MMLKVVIHSGLNEVDYWRGPAYSLESTTLDNICPTPVLGPGVQLLIYY